MMLKKSKTHLSYTNMMTVFLYISLYHRKSKSSCDVASFSTLSVDELLELILRRDISMATKILYKKKEYKMILIIKKNF